MMKKSSSLTEFLKSIQKLDFLPKEILVPLNVLYSFDDDRLFVFTRSILHKIINELIKNIEDNPTTISEILIEVQDYLHYKELHRLYNAIAEKYNGPFPESFLWQISQLDVIRFGETFTSNEARSKIFMQSKFLFERCIFHYVNMFINDPVLLDALFVSTTLKEGDLLPKIHSEICSIISLKLIEQCSDQNELFIHMHNILLDFWKKTRNPLVSTLRLQVSWDIEANPRYFDPFREFSKNIKSYLECKQIMRSFEVGFPDVLMILYSPMFRSLLINQCCFLLQNVIDEIPFKIPRFPELIRSFCPLNDINDVEDSINDIMSLVISNKISHPGKSEIEADIKKMCSKNEEIANMILSVSLRFAKDNESLRSIIVYIVNNAKKIISIPDSITLFSLYNFIMNDTLLDENIHELEQWLIQDHTSIRFLLVIINEIVNQKRMIQECYSIVQELNLKRETLPYDVKAVLGKIDERIKTLD